MSIDDLDELKEIPYLGNRQRIIENVPLKEVIDVLIETKIEDRTFQVSMMRQADMKDCWILTANMDDLLGDFSCYVDEHEEKAHKGYYYSLYITKEHRMAFSENYEKDYFCAKELGRKIWEILIKIGFEVEQVSA